MATKPNSTKTIKVSVEDGEEAMKKAWLEAKASNSTKLATALKAARISSIVFDAKVDEQGGDYDIRYVTQADVPASKVLPSNFTFSAAKVSSYVENHDAGVLFIKTEDIANDTKASLVSHLQALLIADGHIPKPGNDADFEPFEAYVQMNSYGQVVFCSRDLKVATGKAFNDLCSRLDEGVKSVVQNFMKIQNLSKVGFELSGGNDDGFVESGPLYRDGKELSREERHEVISTFAMPDAIYQNDVITGTVLIGTSLSRGEHALASAGNSLMERYHGSFGNGEDEIDGSMTITSSGVVEVDMQSNPSSYSY
jgi:hypothetical protein